MVTDRNYHSQPMETTTTLDLSQVPVICHSDLPVNISIPEIPEKDCFSNSVPDEGYVSTGSPGSVQSQSPEHVPSSAENQDYEILTNFDIVSNTTNDLTNSDFNINVLDINDLNDSMWQTGDLFVKNIDPDDDPELYNAILHDGVKKRINKRHHVKHRRGQTRLDIGQLKDEEHIKNVQRCREYREQLKKKGTTQESELEDLKVENFRLKQKEEHMRATLEKVKKVYLDLIVSGRVTFVQ